MLSEPSCHLQASTSLSSVPGDPHAVQISSTSRLIRRAGEFREPQEPGLLPSYRPRVSVVVLVGLLLGEPP